MLIGWVLWVPLFDCFVGWFGGWFVLEVCVLYAIAFTFVFDWCCIICCLITWVFTVCWLLGFCLLLKDLGCWFGLLSLGVVLGFPCGLCDLFALFEACLFTVAFLLDYVDGLGLIVLVSGLRVLVCLLCEDVVVRSLVVGLFWFGFCFSFVVDFDCLVLICIVDLFVDLCFIVDLLYLL